MWCRTSLLATTQRTEQSFCSLAVSPVVLLMVWQVEMLVSSLLAALCVENGSDVNMLQ